jgi:hypothetical protein
MLNENNFNKIPDIQNIDEKDKTRIRQVSEIEDIDKLINFINALDKIPGTSDAHVFTGPELAHIIKAVKEKKRDIYEKEIPLEAITRTWGIRDKVYELLGENVVSTELEERRQEQEQEPQNKIIEDIEIIPQPVENLEPETALAEQVEPEMQEETLEGVEEIQKDVVEEEEVRVAEEKPQEVASVEKSQEKTALETALEKCDALHDICLQKENQLAEERRKKRGFVTKLWNKVFEDKEIARLTREVENAFANYAQAEQEYFELKNNQ